MSPPPDVSFDQDLEAFRRALAAEDVAKALEDVRCALPISPRARREALAELEAP